MLSNVQALAHRLQKRWVPKWHHAFADQTHGGYYERIADKFKPLDIGYKRLVTQCRQIAIYSHAGYRLEDLKGRFDWVVTHFYSKNRGWSFSVKEDGAENDTTRDLYAHAFVIFTLSLYYKATGEKRAKTLAKDTLKLIDTHFRAEIGLYEALDEGLNPIPKLRRQNPHMHLFEACLFAYDAFEDRAYLAMADEIYDLFKNYFFVEGTLREFFTEDLAPHPEQGYIVEPGHHFEWVWLLQKYRNIQPDTDQKEIIDLMRQLIGWANRHGWDSANGGIYNALDNQGNITDSHKRIWPFAEGLKANAMMLDLEEDKIFLKTRTAEMIEVFRTKYIDKRGFWTEIVTEDLSPASDYLPGTTPYHLYFGIMETLGYLKGRGPSKSMVSGIQNRLFLWRQSLSSAVQFLKAKFNHG